MGIENPKNVGESFELLTSDADRAALYAAAEMYTFAEHAAWTALFRNDPADPAAVARAVAARAATGKFGKLPPYEEMPAFGDESFAVWVGNRCAPLYSYVGQQAAQWARKMYLKQRFEIVTYRRNLPRYAEPLIRAREKAFRILRDERNPSEWFRIEAKIYRDMPPLNIGIKPKGESVFTRGWLSDMADSGEHPSAGVFSLKRRGGKKRWHLALSRHRLPGEIEQVSGPIPGRELLVYAPLDQESFLRCEFLPRRKRPWAFAIEGHDLCLVAQRYAAERRDRAANWRQSPQSGAHGHGRGRAQPMIGERYENRCNDWIENRSAYIVREAVRKNCEGVIVERLQDRDPHSLLVGTFPYFKLVQRILQKAKQAGMDATEARGISEIEKMLRSATEAA